MSGYDVLTTLEAGLANKQTPDEEILRHATRLGRAVLTNNGWDYLRLHRISPAHAGIVTFTDDSDVPALTQRVHTAIAAAEPLVGKRVRVIRPP